MCLIEKVGLYLAYCQNVLHLAPNTVRRYKSCLNLCLPRITELTKQCAYTLFQDNTQEAVTCNKKIEVIIGFLTWLKDEYNIDTTEFCHALAKCKIKHPTKHVKEVLTKEEVERLLAIDLNAPRPATEAKMCLIFSLLYYTGARISEVLNLTKDQVNVSEGFVMYCNTKNNEDRKVYVPQELVLNVSNRGSPGCRIFDVSQQKVGQYLHKKLARLGIKKDVSTHVFRRTLINHLGNDGAPLPVIRSIVGHRSMDAISQYLTTADIKTQKQTQERYNPILSQHSSPKDWLDSEEKRIRERDLSQVKHRITRTDTKLIYEVEF